MSGVILLPLKRDGERQQILTTCLLSFPQPFYCGTCVCARGGGVCAGGMLVVGGAGGDSIISSLAPYGGI